VMVWSHANNEKITGPRNAGAVDRHVGCPFGV